MRQRKALITGFEPYGGRGSNPAFELARGIDGASIAGLNVAGRGLPARFEGLHARLNDLIETEKPDLVISVGLWPGECMSASPIIWRISRFPIMPASASATATCKAMARWR